MNFGITSGSGISVILCAAAYSRYEYHEELRPLHNVQHPFTMSLPYMCQTNMSTKLHIFTIYLSSIYEGHM